MLFNMTKRHLVFGLSLLGTTAAAAPALAEERLCTASLGAVTVDNVRVPQNAVCRLNRTRVQGNVVVERGATLVASRVAVIGNVQADGARNVRVVGRSRIGGSIQLARGLEADVLNSIVDGSIQLTSYTEELEVSFNTVGGDVQAFSNRGVVEISDNVIDGNLQCRLNNPAPIGDDNIVQGNREGQCRQMRPS